MERPKYLHQEKFLTNRIKETLSYEVIISFQMFVGFWWCLYANSQFCLEWEKSPLSCSDKKLSLGRRPLPQLAFRLGFFLHTLPSAPFTLQKAFTLLFWNTVKSWLFNLKKATSSPHPTPLTYDDCKYSEPGTASHCLRPVPPTTWEPHLEPLTATASNVTELKCACANGIKTIIS